MQRALPTWFDDAKLGIFVHWTAASVPAFAPVTDDPFSLAAVHGWEHAMAWSPYVEWYQNSLAIEGSPVWEHHKAIYGDLPYDAFVAHFLAGLSGWDPSPWAELFAAAGAKYVVLVTKHHDGALLWPSAIPNPLRGAAWQSTRDVVGELAGAVRDRGLRFGTYYSGGLDWTFGGLPMTDFRRLFAAIPQGDDYVRYADAHWDELIDRYEPCVLWNDIGYPSSADIESLFERYYDRVPDGVVNNRFDWLAQSAGQRHCDFLTPEYSTEAPAGRKWEATRGIGSSFGYNAEETDDSYLAPDALVHLFVDVVARGGNLLLNVGPNSDGVIPWVQAQRLLALGWWLQTNGPAIFGSRPWERAEGKTGAGDEVRYTAGADGALYAIVLGTPTSDTVELDVEAPDEARVTVLGNVDALPWEPTSSGGTRVTLPTRPATAPALTIRIA